MKKFVLSAALLAVFTGGMTGVVNIAQPGVAMACPSEATRSDALAARMPQVNKGDQGRHVLALQLRLRNEGYKYLQGTGYYGSQTLRAVQDFQRRHGIRASGIVGSKTWHALVGKLPKLVTTNFMGKPAFGIQPGERNQYKVRLLGAMLARVYPYYLDETHNGTYRGVYDASMQKAVRDFQRRAGIKASGIVGPKTWAALDEVISVSGNWGC
ncbi:peptidoglycan-binding domain-containing protein [Actinophytocola sp. KF-1]